MIYKIDDIDVQSLIYSAPKPSPMGGQSVFVNMPSQENPKIVLQTPRCSLPFGLSEFAISGGEKKHSLDLNLGSTTVAMQKFVKFLSDFDAMNKEAATQNSQAWLRKRVDSSVIQELYRPQLKKQGESYPPNMRAKFPTKKDVFLGDIFDANNDPVQMDAIVPGCHVDAILECVGMYFVAREFGVTWKVLQLKVYPPQKLVGYSFVESDDEEDAEPV